MTDQRHQDYNAGAESDAHVRALQERIAELEGTLANWHQMIADWVSQSSADEGVYVKIEAIEKRIAEAAVIAGNKMTYAASLWLSESEWMGQSERIAELERDRTLLLKECREAFPHCEWPTFLDVLLHIVNAASNQRCDNAVLKGLNARLTAELAESRHILKRIAYPQRGTIDEDADIQMFAKHIQDRWTLYQLENTPTKGGDTI